MSLPASVIALANAEYGWRSQALCRDTDPELFFPIGTTGAALLQIEQARAVCPIVLPWQKKESALAVAA